MKSGISRASCIGQVAFLQGFILHQSTGLSKLLKMPFNHLCSKFCNFFQIFFFEISLGIFPKNIHTTFVYMFFCVSNEYIYILCIYVCTCLHMYIYVDVDIYELRTEKWHVEGTIEGWLSDLAVKVAEA